MSKYARDRLGQWANGDNVCPSNITGLDRLRDPHLNKVREFYYIFVNNASFALIFLYVFIDFALLKQKHEVGLLFLLILWEFNTPDLPYSSYYIYYIE